jgi:hypothetical protein
MVERCHYFPNRIGSSVRLKILNFFKSLGLLDLVV